MGRKIPTTDSSGDEIDYDERWGGVHVSMAGPVRNHREELEAAGWTVRLLDGPDHIQAMQAGSVLPVIRPWLKAALASQTGRAAT